ncbi:MAG: acyl-CoA carboxylase subunit beta [Planctomycetes bacterium]|nr:acyl-CoA carboxylase subunit beta [Planctomycetota bacterium]
MDLRENLERLEKARAEALEMGGPEKVERQRSKGKLTVRERLALLFDSGRYEEMGLLARAPGVREGIRTAADGVVTAFGDVGGRPAAVAAYDFTVFGGSMGIVGERKVKRMRELALRRRVPMIWLVDSGGARIHEEAYGGDEGSGMDPRKAADRAAYFASTGDLFFEQSIMSGVIPQVAAMMGPGYAGTAYVPGLADFVPMVAGRSYMALAGPSLVKAAISEEVTEEALGGAAMHCARSGCGDLECESDEACIAAIRDYLSYLPPHCEAEPPVTPTADPSDRREESLLDLLPKDPRFGFDVKKVIRAIADEGRCFEIKPKFAPSMVTAFCRMAGRSVGVVANNSQAMGGIIDCDASDKAARFVMLCDAFNVPLLFLHDVPGFMVGSKVEAAGIIRHGANMIHVVAGATVPKVAVILRRSYGAGYYAMCGASFQPDLIVAWPTAEISIMGPEGLVSIMARGENAAVKDPQVREVVVAMIRKTVSPFPPSEHGYLDDVIDPRETRAVVIQGFARSRTRRVDRPWRKRGVMPV